MRRFSAVLRCRFLDSPGIFNFSKALRRSSTIALAAPSSPMRGAISAARSCSIAPSCFLVSRRCRAAENEGSSTRPRPHCWQSRRRPLGHAHRTAGQSAQHLRRRHILPSATSPPWTNSLRRLRAMHRLFLGSALSCPVLRYDRKASGAWGTPGVAAWAAVVRHRAVAKPCRHRLWSRRPCHIRPGFCSTQRSAAQSAPR